MIYGLIAAAGWGVSSVAAAQGARRMGTLAAPLISQGTGTVALTAVLAVMRPHLLSLPSATMWGLAGAGFFSLVGWLTYYRALEHGPVGIVSGAAATYGGVTALLALLVLGEPLGKYVGAGDPEARACRERGLGRWRPGRRERGQRGWRAGRRERGQRGWRAGRREGGQRGWRRGRAGRRERDRRGAGPARDLGRGDAGDRVGRHLWDRGVLARYLRRLGGVAGLRACGRHHRGHRAGRRADLQAGAAARRDRDGLGHRRGAGRVGRSCRVRARRAGGPDRDPGRGVQDLPADPAGLRPGA